MERKKRVCVHVGAGGQDISNGSQNDPKIDLNLTLKSMIFVIFFAGSMFNFVFWPGGLLFFSRRKRQQQQQQKRKMKQGKTREDKAREAQGKTRQKEQKKTS